jgi:ornithine cyclodeaminase
MRVFGLEEIKRVLPKLDLFPLIKQGFKAYSSGLTVVPPVGEMIFDNPPGDVHIKYGYIKGDDYYVIKIASGFYGDSSLDISPSQGGVMLLFDQKTGQEVGILVDECYLTNVRTAVAGGICAEILAPKKIESIGVIGTGVQARMQVSYLSQVTECRTVKVWGRSNKSVDTYIEDMSSDGWHVDKALTTDDIAESCDLIITATPSKSPLLKQKKLKKGTHITALGSDSPGKQELETGIFQIADLIVADSIVQCVERGDISHAIKDGLINQSDITELGSLIDSDKRVRCRENQITVADLTGVAVQDIQIAKAVYEACERLK